MVFIGLNEFLKFGILGIFGLNLKTGTSQKKTFPSWSRYIYIYIYTCIWLLIKVFFLCSLNFVCKNISSETLTCMMIFQIPYPWFHLFSCQIIKAGKFSLNFTCCSSSGTWDMKSISELWLSFTNSPFPLQVETWQNILNFMCHDPTGFQLTFSQVMGLLVKSVTANWKLESMTNDCKPIDMCQLLGESMTW